MKFTLQIYKKSKINITQYKMKPIDSKLYGVLDSESFQKIFPEEYFTKFAAHLKVLEFQKNLFASPPEPGKLKFTPRPKGPSTQKPKPVQLRTILTKFAKVTDTILNDRQQIIRFKQINKMIAQNMENPQKQLKIHKENHPNEIKKITNQQDVNSKIIDQLMIQSTRQTNQNIQEKLQSLKKKAIFCKFTKRDPQAQGNNKCKVKLQWPSMKRYNSQKKMNSISNNFEATFSKKLLQHSKQQKNQSANELNKLNQQQNNFQLKIPNQTQYQGLNRTRSNSMRALNNISTTNRVKSTRKLKYTDVDKNNPTKVDLVSKTRKLIQEKHLLKCFLYTQQLNIQPLKQNIAQIITTQLAPLE